MMHRSLLSLFIAAPLILVGCDKGDAKKTDDKTEAKEKGDKKKADDDDKGDKKKKAGDDDKGDKKKPADDDKKGDEKKAAGDDKGEKKPADDDKGGRKIDGVGLVPAYAADKSNRDTKCKAKPAAREAMKKLDKGDDDKVTDGSKDIDALEKDIAGDCNAVERDLAVALNDGGLQHYKKKKYDESNRWWRAALTVRPSLSVARYNLACGLALDGKKTDAIWNIQELGKAAKDADAEASNFLEKAKSDDDLKSVRDESDFKDALKASEGALVGPRKEPETAAAAKKLLPKEWFKGKSPDPEIPETKLNPTVVEFWTWRPAEDTELLVATVVSDPAAWPPAGDMTPQFGALIVLRRQDGKLSLVWSGKTSDSLVKGVAKGPSGSVIYNYYAPCADIHASLRWAAGKVVGKEQSCEDASEGKKFAP